MQKPVSGNPLKDAIPLDVEDGDEIPHNVARFKPPAPIVSETPERPIVRIHLLGSMRATTFVGADVLPRGRKARAVLGCLCLAGGAQVPRSRLAAMLWDRVPEFQARASFRQAFRELIVALGPLAEELISSDRETVSLHTNLCWIDALAVLGPAAEHLHRSDLATLCSGELLEGLDNLSVSFDQWLIGERSRFTERLRSLLEADLKQAHRTNRDASERADIARRLIRFDPSHEGASRILMRALADMGERAQALREYARLREVLKRTLDVEPSRESHALYEVIAMVGREEREREREPYVAPRQKRQKAPPPAPARTRLRIGVLPFLATRAAEDDSLAFSLSQEIAAALARFRWFDVIAPVTLMRGTTGTAANDDMLRSSDLDYVVDGALAGSRQGYQISVRLLDLTRYATPVWSDRFELGADELHKVDEMVTAKIVGRIDPVILFIEGQPKRRENHGAAALLMRAMPLLYSMERARFEEAGRLIKRALEIDPDDTMALAWAAYWEMWHVGQGWTPDPGATLGVAEGYCLRAMKLEPDNAEALGIYAHTLAWKKEFDAALYYFDRSLRLNPNLAYVWALAAATYAYVGDWRMAQKRLERYRELAPFDPYYGFFETIYAIAYMIEGDYEQVIAFGTRVIKANPDFTAGYKPVIAALGLLGRIEEAKPYLETLLKLEPNFTIAHFREVYPLRNENDRERYAEGLRLAGVPEG
jgi:DNA-binding SARP family transcriptional activator/TolB-like protein